MSWHAAIDLGAGSGRALVGRVGADELHVEEVHRFHYAPRQAHGHLRWDIDRLFEGVRAGVLAAGARVAAEGASLASAAVDSWGVDYGLIDADGRLTEEPICYRDDRTDGVMERVFASVPREEIYRRTGIQFLQLNTLYQVAAHVREGMPRDAARLLLIPDLCHHLLCGSQVSERSDASTTQLLNVRTGDWDDELFSRLGLPRHLMPPVVATGSDLGPLDRVLSSHAGLAGTRVLACPTHDTASAVAATPLDPGWAYISSGTWSLVGVERTSPMVTGEALAANFTNEAGAFGTIRFLKNVMGLWLLESCRREWEAAGRGVALADLLSGAASVSGFPGLVVPDDPRFFNPSSMVREVPGRAPGRRVGGARRPGPADQGHHRFTRAPVRVRGRGYRARDGRAAWRGFRLSAAGRSTTASARRRRTRRAGPLSQAPPRRPPSAASWFRPSPPGRLHHSRAAVSWCARTLRPRALRAAGGTGLGSGEAAVSGDRGRASTLIRRPLGSPKPVGRRRLLDELPARRVVRVQQLVRQVAARPVGEELGVELQHRRVLVRLAHLARGVLRVDGPRARLPNLG